MELFAKTVKPLTISTKKFHDLGSEYASTEKHILLKRLHVISVKINSSQMLLIIYFQKE